MNETSKPIKNSGKLSVVFFGSGPVAARSLRLLIEDFEIEAVVTKPTTVREMTEVAQDLRVYSVSTRQELDDLIAARSFQSKVGVLIDFGIIVSQKVIDSFPKGIVNSHFSLLPEWRGADPITFAILSGQKRTGVSLMLLVPAMDEGPVLACGVQDISESTTTPELTQELIELSDALLKKELPRYLNGDSEGVGQDELAELIPDHPQKPTYSRKLTKQDGLLDFAKPAQQLEREIRAFIEWPKSRTTLAGKEIIVTEAHVVAGNSTVSKPGDIDQPALNDGILRIETGDGRLQIDTLKPAGKQEMTAKAFLAGHKQHLLNHS